MTQASTSAATYQDWRALVEKTLKGEPIESLNLTTAEGLSIAPLYDAADGPHARFAVRPVNADRPWDIRVGVSHPDPALANRDLLKDLEGGAASAVITIDPSGEKGVAITRADGAPAPRVASYAPRESGFQVRSDKGDRPDTGFAFAKGKKKANKPPRPAEGAEQHPRKTAG